MRRPPVMQESDGHDSLTYSTLRRTACSTSRHRGQAGAVSWTESGSDQAPNRRELRQQTGTNNQKVTVACLKSPRQNLEAIGSRR